MESVDIILKAGANVNVIDEHRRAAVHYAAENGNCEIIRMLVEKGADYKHRDEEGMDAYDLCETRAAREALTGESQGWLSWLCRI